MWRHRAGLDIAPIARAHHELVAGMELIDEGLELPEVVRAVGVAHDDVSTTDEGDGVDVGPAETALWSVQHTCTGGNGSLRCVVRRAVDDDDLAGHACGCQSFVAPLHELLDRDLLVERRNDDGDFGVDRILGRDQQSQCRIVEHLVLHRLDLTIQHCRLHECQSLPRSHRMRAVCSIEGQPTTAATTHRECCGLRRGSMRRGHAHANQLLHVCCHDAGRIEASETATQGDR